MDHKTLFPAMEMGFLFWMPLKAVLKALLCLHFSLIVPESIYLSVSAGRTTYICH